MWLLMSMIEAPLRATPLREIDEITSCNSKGSCTTTTQQQRIELTRSIN